MSKLNHPNIIKFRRVRYNFKLKNTTKKILSPHTKTFESRKHLYIVMEYIPGGNLKNLIIERIKAENYFTEDEIAIIMKHILEAV